MTTAKLVPKKATVHPVSEPASQTPTVIAGSAPTATMGNRRRLVIQFSVSASSSSAPPDSARAATARPAPAIAQRTAVRLGISATRPAALRATSASPTTATPMPTASQRPILRCSLVGAAIATSPATSSAATSRRKTTVSSTSPSDTPGTTDEVDAHAGDHHAADQSLREPVEGRMRQGAHGQQRGACQKADRRQGAQVEGDRGLGAQQLSGYPGRRGQDHQRRNCGHRHPNLPPRSVAPRGPRAARAGIERDSYGRDECQVGEADAHRRQEHRRGHHQGEEGGHVTARARRRAHTVGAPARATPRASLATHAWPIGLARREYESARAYAPVVAYARP